MTASASSSGTGSGGGVAQTSDSAHSTTLSAITSNVGVTVRNGSVPSNLLRPDQLTANTSLGTVTGGIAVNGGTALQTTNGLQNKFDPQQTRNDLAFNQGLATLFGQVANEAAGAQIRNAGWKEDSAEALALHAVIGAAQGAIAGSGSAGSILAGGLGAAAGTYSSAQLQRYLWQDYLQGGAIRPDSPAGHVVILMASAAIGSGIGALTGAGMGGAGIGAVLGGSAAASSTLYNQEEPLDEEVNRPVGPNGEPLTEEEILDTHNFNFAARELAKIDPENPALKMLIPQNYVPTREDVVRMQQALAEARNIKSLNTTADGLQELIKNASVGTENLSAADQATLDARKALLETLSNRSGGLSNLFRLNGDFVGTPSGGAGSPREMPASANPDQTAEQFAFNAFNGRIPTSFKPIPGKPGAWVAEFSDGSAVTFRRAGQAGRDTLSTTATVEINDPVVKGLNSNRILKLKFPRE